MENLQVPAAPRSPPKRRRLPKMSRDYSLVGLTPAQIGEEYIARAAKRAKEAQRKREEADASCGGVEQEAGVGVVECPIVLGHENVDKSQDISHSTGAPSVRGKTAPRISKEKSEAIGVDESKKQTKHKKQKKRTPKFG